MRTSDDVLARARRIKMVAMDVDGVLTDGSITLYDGGEAKTFNARDGLAVTVGHVAGLRFAFVTGGCCAAIERRAADLAIDVVEMGCSRKAAALRDIAARAGLDVSEIAYMGDDWNDLPALQLAGVSAAPADSPYDVRRHADFVAAARGGQGAVREFIEWLLDAQGGWTTAAEAYVAELNAGVAEIRQ